MAVDSPYMEIIARMQADELMPLDQILVEDFCRDPFNVQNHLKVQAAIQNFRNSNKIKSSTDFHREMYHRKNWGEISSDAARMNKAIEVGVRQLNKTLGSSDTERGKYYCIIKIRNLYVIRSAISFLLSDNFIVNNIALREAALDYAVRAVDLVRSEANLSTACHLAIMLSRHEQAAELLGGLIELNPKHIDARLRLVNALLHMGHQREALEQAKRAFVLAPGSESAVRMLWTCAASPAFVRRIRVSSARWPVATSEFGDLKALVKRDVIGNPPSERWLKQGAAITTMGSCFAQNLAHALRAYNLDVTSFPFGEEVNSTFANRAIFERLSAPPHDRLDDEIDRMILSSSLRANIARSDLFILTLGVSQGFFNRASGAFFVHATEDKGYLRKVFQENEYRGITVAQNVSNIRHMIDCLRAIRPGLNVVLTVSPVPINRSFVHASAIQSDCISKSTLRVAAEEVIQAGLPSVHYWPSFEIVRWLSGHLPPGSTPAFGAEDGESRHVSRHLIDLIVELFLETYGDDTVRRQSVAASSDARAS
jgi:tetratricopeptide (TPR) repeat protein